MRAGRLRDLRTDSSRSAGRNWVTPHGQVGQAPLPGRPCCLSPTKPLPCVREVCDLVQAKWVLIGAAVSLLLLWGVVERVAQERHADAVRAGVTRGDEFYGTLCSLLADSESEQPSNDSPSWSERVEAAYQGAVSSFEESYAIEPSVSILVRLGHTHLAIGRLDLARQTFVRAITEWPGTPAAYAGLGDMLFQFGDYRGAIGNYENALWWLSEGAAKLTLDAYDVHLALGESFAALHLPNRAREEFETVLAARPGDTRALVGLLRVLVEQGVCEQVGDLLLALPEEARNQSVSSELIQDLRERCPDVWLQKSEDARLETP